MTIIVFLVDNTASMAQRTYLGISYLDFARQFVENFYKMRQRDPTSASDRYMLMGYDDYPKNVKSGWKERQPQFNEQLRNLRPTGYSSFAEAFFNAIRFVNLNRVQTGIDNYGYGRFPTYTEPVIFISIVDATSDSPRNQFFRSGQFPRLNAPGSELTDEPYRWDHKLFVVFLDVPGHVPQRLEAAEGSTEERRQVESIVERMNGRAFSMDSPRAMGVIIENILQRMQQPGVFVRFHRLPQPSVGVQNGKDENRPSNWEDQLTTINRVGKPGAHSIWPIPEAFWPDQSANLLPARRVYPEIAVRCEQNEVITMPNMPFDEYIVDSCPMTEVIANDQNPNVCWQLFVSHSARNKSIGFPFGYLKLAEDLKTVKMIVFPYNYPLLYSIIEECRDERLKKANDFKINVGKYFTNIPAYYIQLLRKTLRSLNVQIPHPLMLENTPISVYNPLLLSQMKKWREVGKEEYEATCQQVANFINPNHPEAVKVFPLVNGVYQLPMVPVTNYLTQMNSVATKVGLLRKYQTHQPTQSMFKGVKVSVTKTPLIANPSSKFHNPYDIKRTELVEQLEKMRNNLDSTFTKRSIALLEGGLPGQRLRLQHAEDLHSLPVGKMGDYQEYLKRMAEIGRGPLRELEPQQSRPHAFGNPFKYDKKSMAIDEVNEMNPPDVEPNAPRQFPDRKQPLKPRVQWPKRRRAE